MLIFDYEGCNSNKGVDESRETLLEKARLNGFDDDSMEAILIKPELELWAWRSKYHLGKMTGWSSSRINDWLKKNQFSIDNGKPKRPKEAFEALLDKTMTPNSSSNFAKLASKITLGNCGDPAFQLFLEKLRQWFPKQN